MALKWRYECDGSGCKATELTPPMHGAPAGWLQRTIIDRVETLEGARSAGDYPKGSSELQRVEYFCDACRRKRAHAA